MLVYTLIVLKCLQNAQDAKMQSGEKAIGDGERKMMRRVFQYALLLPIKLQALTDAPHAFKGKLGSSQSQH